MIRTLFALLPPDTRSKTTTHLILTVLSAMLRAGTAVALVPLIAALFGQVPKDAWPWVALLVALTVAGWIVDWLVARIGFDLGFGLLDTGQHAVADQISRTRLTWFNAQNTATARQAIASTGPELVGLMIYLVTPLLSAILLPIAIAIALVPIAWQLGLAALAGVPILLGAYVAASRIGRAANQGMMDANSSLTERIVEFARTQHALRAARRVAPEHSLVGEALAHQHGATRRLLLMQIPGQLLFSLASQLVLIILAGTTVVLASSGKLSVPEAIALIVVIVRYLEPFTVLAELSTGVEISIGTLRRMHSVLNAPQTNSGTEEAIITNAASIRLEDVRFGYGGDDLAVLDGFDLTLQPGTTTAIVGPSGSGKSTVLALLAGLHDPGSGRILIDDIDAASLTAEARAKMVSVVFQHPYLFDGTIRENILAGNPDATDPEMKEVARLARVDSVTNRLPDGWDARVGEAGTSLSGGERQRVSIARALLKPAPLLLVDEATSALDTENEIAITAALTDDSRSRTRVIVAHRLGSIRAADRVIFLEDGRIVEDGSIDELLAADCRFAEFWRQQDAATGWRLGTTPVA
ncbi:MAG: ABC transporter ATP-binding protein [Thermomicrobiales bacterium]|nr:ABC transporter ATP-binding protein [Thermomicrobiales bacterium]